VNRIPMVVVADYHLVGSVDNVSELDEVFQACLLSWEPSFEFMKVNH